MDKHFLIGMDVGSTTVKAVVIDAATDEILWQDYQRHDTKQPEKVLEFLQALRGRDRRLRGRAARGCSSPARAATGMAKLLGAKFVQEVNAVSLAVEKLYPEVRLGHRAGRAGRQDHHLQDGSGDRPQEEDPVDERQVRRRHRRGHRQDQRQARASPPTSSASMGYQGIKLHTVAGKCGVFAETDINGLQKMGVPPDELMASLFEAIVHAEPLGADARQHAAARWCCCSAARTATSRACANAGRHNIPKIWEERGVAAARGRSARGPDQDARQRAVLRRARRGRVRQDEDDDVGRYLGLREARAVHQRRPRGREGASAAAASGCARTTTSSTAFKEKYRTKKFTPATFQPGEVVEGFVGIDGGSTSTKAVLLSKDHKRRILAKTYQLSKGNPIEDTIEILEKLRRADRDQGATLEDPRRRHHRVRQGHPEGRDRRGRRAGRDRRAHRVRRCTSTRTST